MSFMPTFLMLTIPLASSLRTSVVFIAASVAGQGMTVVLAPLRRKGVTLAAPWSASSAGHDRRYARPADTGCWVVTPPATCPWKDRHDRPSTRNRRDLSNRAEGGRHGSGHPRAHLRSTEIPTGVMVVGCRVIDPGVDDFGFPTEVVSKAGIECDDVQWVCEVCPQRDRCRDTKRMGDHVLDLGLAKRCAQGDQQRHRPGREARIAQHVVGDDRAEAVADHDHRPGYGIQGLPEPVLDGVALVGENVAVGVGMSRCKSWRNSKRRTGAGRAKIPVSFSSKVSCWLAARVAMWMDRLSASRSTGSTSRCWLRASVAAAS